MASTEDRQIILGDGLPPIPERLLIAHSRGQVLFITGAGTSKGAGLPDFRELVVDVYEVIDRSLHEIVRGIPKNHAPQAKLETEGLNAGQLAELNRFIRGDYDVVLGMLERRMNPKTPEANNVRLTISNIIAQRAKKPASIHRSLARLADRGSASAIATTNFDLLLEAASQHSRRKLSTHSLGAIPKPSRTNEFSGVLHIHGVLNLANLPASNIVVTDQDFGEIYLRRREVPDFIYDAARLYHLVLVGYSANDAPMRYLLNAVAADSLRFDDLKTRYAFVGSAWPPDSVEIEDWKGRGITPIPYSSDNGHISLAQLLERWAKLSAITAKSTTIESEIRRIVRTPRTLTTDAQRDLFDHIVRRANRSEHARMAKLISKASATVDWLDALIAISREPRQESA